jgi:hypothetical protein
MLGVQLESVFLYNEEGMPRGKDIRLCHVHEHVSAGALKRVVSSSGGVITP